MFVLVLTMNMNVFAAGNVYISEEDVKNTSNTTTQSGEVLLNSFNLSAAPGNNVSRTINLSGHNKYRVKLVLFGPTSAMANVNLKLPGGNTHGIWSGTVPYEQYTKTYDFFGSGDFTVILETWSNSPTGFVLHAAVYGL